MRTLCIKYATLLRLDPALTRSSPIPFSRFKKMSLRCEWPGMQCDGVESKTFEERSISGAQRYRQLDALPEPPTQKNSSMAGAS